MNRISLRDGSWFDKDNAKKFEALTVHNGSNLLHMTITHNTTTYIAIYVDHELFTVTNTSNGDAVDIYTELLNGRHHMRDAVIAAGKGIPFSILNNLLPLIGIYKD